MKHQDYLNFLSACIETSANDNSFNQILQTHKEEFLTMEALELDPALEVLNRAYSTNKGAPPRHPLSMLRSLILMSLLGIRGINEWVRKLRSIPLFAVLSGFDPKDTPGVGTFYDFIRRLVDAPHQKPCDHVVPRSRRLAGGHRRSLKKEKADRIERHRKGQTLSEQTLETIEAEADEPRTDNLQKILEDLLITVGIKPSIEAGLLENLKELSVSGDGSILETAASSKGRRTCECKGPCDHERIYSSATAQWCFDVVHNVYKFGDRYYHLAAAPTGCDLPLIFLIPGGNRSDYTLSLEALERFRKAVLEHQLPIRIQYFIGDGHHDSNAHYRYLKAQGIIPVIPLSELSRKAYPHCLEERGIETDTDGTPLCPGGKPMRYFQFNKKKQAHVYVCPAKRNTHRDGRSIYVIHEDECPLAPTRGVCRPDKALAPTVYVKADTDPRYYPPIPRNTQKFKDLAKERNASERLNSVIDNHGLEKSTRCVEYAAVRLNVFGIMWHARARCRKRIEEQGKEALFEQALERLGLASRLQKAC